MNSKRNIGVVVDARTGSDLLKPGDVYYNRSGIKVRKTRRSDIDYLKDRLRQSDIEEIWASNHLTPQEALDGGWKKSLICLTIQNGHPVAMMGINPESFLGSRAVIWLLGSDDLDKISLRFVRNSRKFVDLFLDYYPYLYNYVDERNVKSIEWLKYLGAKFDNPIPFGEEGLPFRRFYFNSRKK